jgi:hypothetical protein
MTVVLEPGDGPQRGRPVNLRFVRSAVVSMLLPIWFAIYAVVSVVNFAIKGFLGIDFIIYRHAAEVALAGGNPWAIEPNLMPFAGPPPTLLFYVPLALIPLPVAMVVAMSLTAAAAVWAIRHLGLPLWWLLFPPLFDALIGGNPDALVLPLLLVSGPLAGLAAVLKAYALVPLILQRRWGAVAIAAAVSTLSVTQLPNFVASATTVGNVLGTSARLSAWGTWLAIPVIAALWLQRRRGAEWLIVPALWPNTQGHYAAMSLPVVRHYPLAAAMIGLNIPLAPPLAVIAVAVEDRIRSRRPVGPSAR